MGILIYLNVKLLPSARLSRGFNFFTAASF